MAFNQTKEHRSVFEAVMAKDVVSLGQALERMNSSERTSLLSVDRGFDLGIIDTSLLAAVQNEDLDCVKVLLKYNANTECRSTDMFTDPKGRCYFSCTPLCCAAVNGNVDILSCLIKNGADANAREGYHHFTPLMLACGHVNAVTFLITGLPVRPVIKWAFGRLRRKTASRGREDTRVWYQETMFSQMVSYDFLLHEPLHGYVLYLVCAPPEKPTKRCELEEGCLRFSKRFDHGSHSIIVLLFEFKSVR